MEKHSKKNMKVRSKKAKHSKIKENKTNKKKIVYLTLMMVLLAIFIIAGIYIIKYFIEINNVNKASEELNNIDISEVPKDSQETERMLKVKELQKQNSDIKAWIEIEGTKINYPVMQGEDNSFYMTHTYKKKYSSWGSLFLDKDYDWSIPSTNLLIYGHNNKNGTMFKDLEKYKKEKFYKEHPIIRFTTNSEDAEYEIISVFLSKVYYKSDTNVFRYYYFINAENEDEFNEYINNAKKASLYDTGKTAKYGDQLITLSTCSYHVKDGRLVVVARKK